MAPTAATATVYLTWRTALLGLFFPLYFIPILAYRFLVILCAKCFRPDLTHMLSSHGALLLEKASSLEPNFNIVVSIRVEDRRANLTELRTRVLTKFVNAEKRKTKVLAYPELKQYCVCWGGYFFWKTEPNFNVEEHVVFKSLLSAAVDAEHTLDTLRTEYVREALPAGRSPWQMLVVEPPTTADVDHHYHIFFKYHHSLGDGVAILEAFIRLVDGETSILFKPPTPRSPRKDLQPQRSWATDVLRWVAFPFKLGTALFRLVTMTTPTLPWTQLPNESFAGEPEAAIRTHYMPGGVESVPLERLKQIAKGSGVTVSAVIYAGVSGGLRQYLLDEHDHHSIPHFIRVPQPIPYPIRPAGLSNTFSAVTLKLPIGEPDPKKRLFHCERMLTKCKRSQEAWLMFIGNEILSMFPTVFRRRLGTGSWQVGVTNIPGPQSPLVLNGQRVCGICQQMGVIPIPLFVQFFSYCGVVSWTCNGDVRVFKDESDVARLSQLISQEFDALEGIQVFIQSTVPCELDDHTKVI